MREIRNRFIKDLFRSFIGPQASWHAARYASQLSREFPQRLEDALGRIAPHGQSSTERPIFLLSAGWRSGSTMLQRMVMANNPDIIIWGEPFDLANVHDGLSNQFRAFTRDWPPPAYFMPTSLTTDLSDTWVANLYPSVEDLLGAHRRFYDALFAVPARRSGKSSWGMKEVRLTIDHARYFRLLYPHCKIVLLHRNPFDAYRSYRRWRTGVFRRWPDRFVATPYAFGRNWAELTSGFLEGDRAVGAYRIRYEDLDNPAKVRRLSDYLGWAVPRSSEIRRIRDRKPDSASGRPDGDRVPFADRLILGWTTRKARRNAGYALRSSTASA